MEVVVRGRSIVLGPSTFVAEGGEARIHAVDATAYKIYKDPARVPDDDRLRWLARLASPGLITPQDDVFDNDGRRVGFTLAHLDGWVPLVRLFSPAYQRREGLGADHIADLLERLRDRVLSAHHGGAVIADLSELNVLVRPDHGELALIDVDSWGIGPHSPRALSESIRDRHASRPSVHTDWFAYAILAFQLLVGIHPYRGRHPRIRGLDERMSRDLSVLASEVVVPPMVDLTKLPDTWRTWFEDVFHRRLRAPPPPACPARLPITTTVGLRARTLFEAPEPFVSGASSAGHLVIWTRYSLYVDGRRVGDAPPPGSHLLHAHPPTFLRLARGQVLVDRGGHLETSDLQATALFSGPGGVFGRVGQTLVRYRDHGRWLGQTLVGHLPSRGAQLHRSAVLVRHPAGDRLLVLGPTTATWRTLPDLDGVVLDAVANDGLALMLVEGPRDRHLLLVDEAGHRVFPATTSAADLLVLDGRVVVVPCGETTWLLDRRAPLQGGREVRATLPDAPFVHEGRPTGIDGCEALGFTLVG